MTLAMTLGMSIGVKKTLWMMWGELLGVASVAILSVIGISSIMLKLPFIFQSLKFIGALYLLYVGINLWRSKGKLALSNQQQNTVTFSKIQLFKQGFITAIANPKGWAFMVSLLPPFINSNYALPLQLFVLICIIIISEFICMMLYATGGKTIGRILTQENNVKRLNKVSGSLMIAVAIWLGVS
jgi:threonine/homoserine/homoserine lactone efflux protein